METARVDSILVGDRIREDMGDLDALAESIERFGLIQPVVLDADNVLVAGGRRLAAVKRLGWETIPIRRFETLSARDRLNIEVEENERRQGLSIYERSKAIARLAALARDAATEEAAEAGEFRADGTRKSRGRPPVTGSLRDLERRLGIDEATIRTAERHVRAVESYPELAALSQDSALTLAGLLDSVPAGERSVALERLASGEGPFWVERQLESAVVLSKHIAGESDVISIELVTSRTSQRERTLATPALPASALPSPSLTPEQEASLSRQRLRGDYLRLQESAGDLLALRPRAVRQVLEPADVRDVRAFIARLRSWLDEWEDTLR